MARVFKRGKTWYINYSFEGKRRVKAIGKYKKIAELTLKDIEVRIAKKKAHLALKRDFILKSPMGQVDVLDGDIGNTF